MGGRHKHRSGSRDSRKSKDSKRSRRSKDGKRSKSSRHGSGRGSEGDRGDKVAAHARERIASGVLRVDVANAQAFQSLLEDLTADLVPDTVSLSGHAVSADHLAELGPALARCRVVRDLSLSQCSLTDDSGIEALTHALHEHPSLYTLDLSHNQLGSLSGGYLSAMLRRNTQLSRLVLDHNNLCDEGLQHISSSLFKNKTLLTLSLSHNNAGELGAEAVMLALERNEGLDTVNLANNNLGVITNLDRALAKNSTIERLDLSFTKLSSGSVSALAHALRTSPSLTSVVLAGNNLNDAGALWLARATLMRDELIPRLTIDLSQNPIGPRGAHVLSVAVQHNKRLIVMLDDARAYWIGRAVLVGDQLVPKLAMLWVIVELLQLAAFPFTSPLVPWNATVPVLRSITSIMAATQLVLFSAAYTDTFYLLAAVAAVAAAMFLPLLTRRRVILAQWLAKWVDPVYMAYTYSVSLSKQPRLAVNLFAVLWFTLHAVTFLATTLLAVPVLRALLQSFHCSVDTGVWQVNPAVACFSPDHVPIVVPSLVLLLPFLYAAFRLTGANGLLAMTFDARNIVSPYLFFPLSGSSSGSSSPVVPDHEWTLGANATAAGRASLLVRLVLVSMSVFLAQWPRLLIAAYTIGTLVLIEVMRVLPMFERPRANRARLIGLFIVLWTNAASVAVVIINDRVDQLMMLLWLVGIGPIAALATYFIVPRFRRLRDPPPRGRRPESIILRTVAHSFESQRRASGSVKFEATPTGRLASVSIDGQTQEVIV